MNKKIFFSLTLFALIVVALIYIFRDKEPIYAVSPEETMKILADDSTVVKTKELQVILMANNNTNLLIDIRTPDAFVKGHLPEAVNLPANSLLSDESISFFKEMKEKKANIVLYGETRSDANAPWLILRQLGYDNVRILEGGYANTLLPDSLKIVSSETAICNYAEAAKPLAKSEQPVNPEKPVKKAVKIAPVKKAAAAEGGC